MWSLAQGGGPFGHVCLEDWSWSKVHQRRENMPQVHWGKCRVAPSLKLADVSEHKLKLGAGNGKLRARVPS